MHGLGRVKLGDLVLLAAAVLAAGSVANGQQGQQAVVPEEARPYFVQANTLFKQAQSKEDYAQAVTLYQQALKAAPQWGNAWYNLSKAQEKLEKYDDAIDSLKHFLQYSPQDPEARAAQDHVYELEAVKDRALKRADSPEGKAEALRRRFAGYKVVKVWQCRIVVKNGQRGCTEAEAAGSHWDGDWASPPTADPGR